jgi:hypothetical protein
MNTQSVLVIYQDGMVLRIPMAATNLVLPRPPSENKLTFAAITELVSLAEQWEVLCLSTPTKSGHDSALPSRPKSLKSSS